MGLILDQQGKEEEAITVLNEAVKLKSNYKEPLLLLGTIYKKEKKNTAAINAYERALQITGNDEEATTALKLLQGR